jgi:hypothetical protein
LLKVAVVCDAIPTFADELLHVGMSMDMHLHLEIPALLDRMGAEERADPALRLPPVQLGDCLRFRIGDNFLGNAAVLGKRHPSKGVGRVCVDDSVDEPVGQGVPIDGGTLIWRCSIGVNGRREFGGGGGCRRGCGWLVAWGRGCRWR